jgi:Ca2+-binding RTX toxin-like protein
VWEGGMGIDTALVSGGNGNDIFTIQANGGRVNVVQQMASRPIDPDMAGIEQLRIYSGGGSDRISVGDLTGTDLQSVWIDAGAGNDRVDASAMKAGVSLTILGGSGNDRLLGGAGDDILIGGTGNDEIRGGGGNDLIFGSCGNDKIYGGDGDDRLFGGWGNDKIYGGDGNDLLVGGPGHDILKGEAGDDTLVDWHGKQKHSKGHGHNACHEAKLHPCASWVKNFVNGHKTDDPNCDIKIMLTSPKHNECHSSFSKGKRR